MGGEASARARSSRLKPQRIPTIHGNKFRAAVFCAGPWFARQGEARSVMRSGEVGTPPEMRRATGLHPETRP
jgi:hypothetical protein